MCILLCINPYIALLHFAGIVQVQFVFCILAKQSLRNNISCLSVRVVVQGGSKHDFYLACIYFGHYNLVRAMPVSLYAIFAFRLDLGI